MKISRPALRPALRPAISDIGNSFQIERVTDRGRYSRTAITQTLITELENTRRELETVSSNRESILGALLRSEDRIEDLLCQMHERDDEIEFLEGTIGDLRTKIDGLLAETADLTDRASAVLSAVARVTTAPPKSAAPAQCETCRHYAAEFRGGFCLELGRRDTPPTWFCASHEAMREDDGDE